MTALAVAAGGGAMIAMSAAQAAAFTPTPSTSPAAPAPQGDSARTLPNVTAGANDARAKFGRAVLEGLLVGTAPHAERHLDRAAMVEVPERAQVVWASLASPCKTLSGACPWVLYLYVAEGSAAGQVAGYSRVVRAYRGDEVLDSVAAPARRR